MGVTSVAKTFLLGELLTGMSLTARTLFRKKYTVNYPEEKTPQSPRFRKRTLTKPAPACRAAFVSAS